ncbi:hypothetical protein B0T14DRAFT_517689 [Immersiella caudata]|uniref:Uncharacterized protein n=1 Tax=Immersiella caudata TaxID=314043 RepID=A0AA39WZI6_9PEZI|nr:hypothetical protein B0T14DRAFT_517689 [Immersiella caudata]
MPLADATLCSFSLLAIVHLKSNLTLDSPVRRRFTTMATPRTLPPDEHLPEVVPARPFEADHESSPQVVSHLQNEASERDKYPVVYDTSPKLFDDTAVTPVNKQDHAIPQTWTPSDATAPTPITTPWEPLPAGAPGAADPTKPPGDERRICGLQRRTFFIAAIITSILLLAAIIGGAVGGSLSNKSSTQSAPQDASQQTSPPGTTPSTSSPPSPTTSPSSATSSSSSSSTPTPTVLTLNNSTAPRGLAFQAFQSPEYLGAATPIIQAEGFHDLNITANSYVWLPDGTECCLTFCANRTTATGWWCNRRFQTESSGPFGRVYVWCGGNDGVKNVTCS